MKKYEKINTIPNTLEDLFFRGYVTTVKLNVNSVGIHPQLSHPLLQNQKNEKIKIKK
jgi:hypothetical protein